MPEYECNSEMNQNYDKEFYNRVANKNNEELNCSVPFHPVIMSKNNGKTIEICKHNETGKKAVENWLSLLDSGADLLNNKPCTEMHSFLGLPDKSENNIGNQPNHEAFVRLYMNSELRVKSIVMYYDFTALAADIGGYIGMFLGISLVDFTVRCNTVLFKYITQKLKQKMDYSS